MKKIIIFIILIVSILSFAHVPFFHVKDDNNIFIDDIYLSQIHYYEFTDNHKKIEFNFFVKNEENLYILLGVPKIYRSNNFNFEIKITDENENSIDIFDTLELKSEEMYEPFGDTYSWQYLRYDKSLPEGMYKVVLTSNQKGKAWIAFGKREEFTLEQILSLPVMIQDIRNFHELEGIATWEKYALGISSTFFSILVLLLLKKK